MTIDDLRSGFVRITAGVVPEESPYPKLMARARRRRRGRIAGLGAALAGLVAAALVAPSAIGVGGGGLDELPWQGPVGTGYPLTEWTRRLIESPTRGNLAANRALISELASGFDHRRLGMSRKLPQVKVLFAEDNGTARQVVVAYHNGTAAGLVVRTARSGATVQDLLGNGGLGNLRPEPFSVLEVNRTDNSGSRPVIGLAPAGCRISVADTTSVTDDGQLRLTWTPVPTSDYVVAPDSARLRGWWRVECDGTVRQQGPAGFGVREISATGGKASTAGTRQVALGSYGLLTSTIGLTTPASGNQQPKVLWSGKIPVGDGHNPEASLVGPANAAGPVVLQIGAYGDSLVALASPDQATPDDEETMAASRADWSLVATASATSADLRVVRIPQRDGGHAVLSDWLLVLAPAGAATVRAVAANGMPTPPAPVTDGVAVLRSIPVGAKVVLEAYGSGEKPLATAPLREPADGERLFDEPLVRAW